MTQNSPHTAKREKRDRSPDAELNDAKTATPPTLKAAKLDPSVRSMKIDLPEKETESPFYIAANVPPFSRDLSKGIRTIQRSTINKSPGLDLVYYKQFITKPTSTEFFNWCLNSLPWYKVQYRARGTEIDTPRYTTVFGQDETRSDVRKYKKLPRPIPDGLMQLKEQVELATGAKYNFTLLNFYQDGQNSITYHSDDESFLGPLPTIASLTLGGTRDFLMRNKADAKKKEKFILEDGDLLVMQGSTQSQWLHSIPKRAKASPRINITFRKAINVAGTDNYYRYNVGDGPKYKFLEGKMQVAQC